MEYGYTVLHGGGGVRSSHRFNIGRSYQHVIKEQPTPYNMACIPRDESVIFFEAFIRLK